MNTRTTAAPKSAKKSSRKNVKAVKSNGFDAEAIAAMLAAASPEQLASVAKVSRATAAEKKKVEAAKQKVAKAKEARLRCKTAHAGHASLTSELYKNKRGVISRKVFLRSDQPGAYGKGQHQTCLMETDVAALARIVESCGADALAEIILAAKADQDASISA